MNSKLFNFSWPLFLRNSTIGSYGLSLFPELCGLGSLRAPKPKLGEVLELGSCSCAWGRVEVVGLKGPDPTEAFESAEEVVFEVADCGKWKGDGTRGYSGFEDSDACIYDNRS